LINSDSTLADVCFAVASALQEASIEAVLTGDGAATIYAPEVRTSLDADFVLRRAIKSADLAAALAPLGFRPAATRGMFEHPDSPFTIDFPKGPLAVGGDYVQATSTLTRGETQLRILTPTDCVKDRLAHFFFWDDRTALQAAVGVARSSHASEIDYDELEKWTAKENTAGTDFRPKLEQFLTRAQVDRKTHLGHA
jgi:hypothetical protein